MNIPADLLYNKTHEWAKVEGDIATVGITDFAQDALGDITYVEMPGVGDSVEAGAEFGSVESVKAASDLISPVTGEVTEVNAALEDDPAACNADPFGKGWIMKVKVSAKPDLLDAAAYKEVCASEAH